MAWNKNCVEKTISENKSSFHRNDVKKLNPNNQEDYICSGLFRIYNCNISHVDHELPVTRFDDVIIGSDVPAVDGDCSFCIVRLRKN